MLRSKKQRSKDEITTALEVRTNSFTYTCNLKKKTNEITPIKRKAHAQKRNKDAPP